jgi:hypothetical protein
MLNNKILLISRKLSILQEMIKHTKIKHIKVKRKHICDPLCKELRFTWNAYCRNGERGDSSIRSRFK